MSVLQYSSSKHDDITLITISGSLDAETAPKFSKKLQGEIEKGSKKVLCNLENIEFIASAGLGVLISANQSLQKNGGEIRLAGLSDKITKIFKVMGFINLFKIK
mgnify:CR=1 FL=1